MNKNLKMGLSLFGIIISLYFFNYYYNICTHEDIELLSLENNIEENQENEKTEEKPLEKPLEKEIKRNELINFFDEEIQIKYDDDVGMPINEN
jgi:hypothetical protein